MKNYKNPIIATDTKGHGYTADPYVLRWKDKYYHCYRGEGGVYIGEADFLWELDKAKAVLVYKTPNSGIDSQWYAPELHHINDAWYIYGSPCTDDDNRNHCMTVLEYKGETPIGLYENMGMVGGLENTWTLDGTVLEHNGKHYFIWSSGSDIKMAEMENPRTLKGDFITLSTPEYEFETRDGLINEGPAVLKRKDKIHIVYSANNSKADSYCLGILTYSGGDIMDLSSWKKTDKAVFEGTKEIFGPGHCSFTTVCENNEEIDYIVYHANLASESGWLGRSVWIQPFTFDDNDMPLFGVPKI